MHWTDILPIIGLLVVLAMFYWWGRRGGLADGRLQSDILCGECQKRVASYFGRNYVRKEQK